MTIDKQPLNSVRSKKSPWRKIRSSQVSERQAQPASFFVLAFSNPPACIQQHYTNKWLLSRALCENKGSMDAAAATKKSFASSPPVALWGFSVRADRATETKITSSSSMTLAVASHNKRRSRSDKISEIHKAYLSFSPLLPMHLYFFSSLRFWWQFCHPLISLWEGNVRIRHGCHMVCVEVKRNTRKILAVGFSPFLMIGGNDSGVSHRIGFQKWLLRLYNRWDWLDPYPPDDVRAIADLHLWDRFFVFILVCVCACQLAR